MGNKRKYTRFELVEDVMFAHRSTNPYCYFGGSTINYSMAGICFASLYEVELGDKLCLKMIGDHLQSCTSVDGLTCMAEVKWCRCVRSSKEPTYHIGLNYFGQVPDLFKPSL